MVWDRVGDGFLAGGSGGGIVSCSSAGEQQDDPVDMSDELSVGMYGSPVPACGSL